MTLRRFVAILLVVLCAAPALALDGSKEAPVTKDAARVERPFLGGFLRETRVLYPLQVGSWEAGEEHLYDEQAAGASVRYVDPAHPERLLHLYFYPAGVLEDDRLDEAFEGERGGLEYAGKSGPWDDLVIGDTRRFEYRVPQEKDALVGYSRDAQMERKGRRLHSALTLQYQNLYFVKGRLSVSRDDLPASQVREILEGFTRDVAAQLQVRSGGECWQPLPITLMPRDGVPADQQVILTMGKKGGVQDVVTRDGVWSREPGGIQAGSAMLLGMASLGRLHPGCVAMEELNAPVPEGMRELRMEFHAQDDVSQDPAPRLQPTRAAEG